MIKTAYEYIHFKEVQQKPKTKIYACLNNKSKSTLGHVGWNGPWRQYVFIPLQEMKVILSAGCLKDIAGFIEQINRIHKGVDK